jgi:hypothetical protein
VSGRFPLPPAAACAALVLWCAGLAAGANGAPAAPSAGHGSRLAPFFARVRGAGRAEVRIERRAFDPAAAREHVTRGRVALEPPQCARVDFDGGETVTLREDGGEWLQPQLRQLVRLTAARAHAALGWCDLLIGPEGGIVQRDLPDGRVLLVRRNEAESDSAWVTLDTQGQPAQLAFRAGADEAERVKLKGWSFGARRGAAAFRLAPPHHFEVVELP